MRIKIGGGGAGQAAVMSHLPAAVRHIEKAIELVAMRASQQ
jgi:hypothetical protein